jgi:hypothetical protein
MDRRTFLKLLTLLASEKGDLTDFPKVSAGEKLMIFIQVLKGNSLSVIAHKFKHSTSSISIFIHEVSDCFMKNEDILSFKHLDSSPLSDRILKNPKYFPWFDNYDGALEGIHIPAVVPEEDQGVFRNRKKINSQNVLGVCNFEARFIYALCGWEGSAHGGRVFEDAVSKILHLRLGNYHLADAGYGLSWFTLTPYKGVCYHLKEWSRGNLCPRNYKELYNLRHLALRNVIERIFGIMKKRFPILCMMPSFSFSFQCALVYFCMMVHNFITVEQIYENEFDDWEERKIVHDNDDVGPSSLSFVDHNTKIN